MSATDIATVVEGWATLVGLMVVVIGAMFAGLQFRQEARSRHLQAMISLFSDIRPIGAVRAFRGVMALPDQFDFEGLGQKTREEVVTVLTGYGRLGLLLNLGLVNERDVFPDPALSRQAIEVWEKFKHFVQADRAERGSLATQIPKASTSRSLL